MTASLPSIGTIVFVSYNGGKQPARVVGFTTTGKAKCRGFNMSCQKWLPNLKNVDADDIIGPVPADMVFPSDDVRQKPRRH